MRDITEEDFEEPKQSKDSDVEADECNVVDRCQKLQVSTQRSLNVCVQADNHQLKKNIEAMQENKENSKETIQGLDS